jgi:hypothetical protein
LRHSIGIASRDHVMKRMAGRSCQPVHGKAAPVKRLAPGDWIAYYQPDDERAESL